MTVMIGDLKVGMKVKIVDSEKILSCKLFNDMTEYFGKVYTVKSIYPLTEQIKLKEDKTGWHWDIKLIEKIVDDKERKNKVYTSFDEIIEKEGLSEGLFELRRTYLYSTDPLFKFQKCIVNDNCTIGIFRVRERIYKGIAKCHPNDEFSLAKGLTIAMLRAYKDYLDREIKKLY